MREGFLPEHPSRYNKVWTRIANPITKKKHFTSGRPTEQEETLVENYHKNFGIRISADHSPTSEIIANDYNTSKTSRLYKHKEFTRTRKSKANLEKLKKNVRKQ